MNAIAVKARLRNYYFIDFIINLTPEMEAFVHKPENELKDAVECIWYQDTIALNFNALNIPFLNQELIINLGGHFSITHGTSNFGYAKGNAYASGLYQVPMVTHVREEHKAIGVMFKPHGLYQLFGYAAERLNQGPTDLRNITNSDTSALISKIGHLSAPQEKIEALEKYLLSYSKPEKICSSILDFANETGDEPLKRGRIKQHFNNASIAKKQYLKAFKNVYGHNPKRHIQIKQVNHAVYMIARCPETGLSDVAYECGFYDQAHFIRLFRQFSGMTPFQYKAAVLDKRVQLSFPNTIYI